LDCRRCRRGIGDVVGIGAQITGVSRDIESRVYDAVMPMFSDSGRFDPKAVGRADAFLRRSQAAAGRTGYVEALHREIPAGGRDEITTE